MELLESQDPSKKKLIEQSERYKQEMQRQLKDVSDNSEKMLKNALIIGGALALTYAVVNQLSSTKSKKKKAKIVQPKVVEAAQEETEEESPSMLSHIGDKLVNTATLFLLDIAKEKLSDYLRNKKQNDAHS